MNEMPQTTLTQRRNQITGGAKKLTKDKFDGLSGKKLGGSGNSQSSPMGGASGGPLLSDKTAILKVAIWIVAVVFIGVGAALFVTNVILVEDDDNDNEPVAETPISFPTDPVADFEPDVELPEPDFGEDPEPGADEPVDDEPVDDEPDQPTTPGANQSPTSPTSGSVTEAQLAEYSAQNRSLAPTAQGSNLILSQFRFFETASEFNYVFTDVASASGQIDPEVNVSYESNNLIVEFANVRTDNVTGNGGNTERTFNNVVGITGTQTSNRNGVSRYQFNMNDKFEHKVVIDREQGEIRIQIQNRG